MKKKRKSKLVPVDDDLLKADIPDQSANLQQDNTQDSQDDLHGGDLADQAADEDRQGQPQTVVNHGEERTGIKRSKMRLRNDDICHSRFT